MAELLLTSPHVPLRLLTPPLHPLTSPYASLCPYIPLHPLRPLTSPLGVLMFELLAAHSPWDEIGQLKNEMQADAHAHTHMHTRTRTRAQTHTHTHAHAQTHVCMHVNAHVCMHVCVQVYAAITAHGQDGAPPLRFPAGVTEAARGMINELMEPNLDDRLGCHLYIS